MFRSKRTMNNESYDTADVGMTRQSFLRGIGVTIAAGAGLVLLPKAAGASTSAGCTSYCRPSNCGAAGCPQNAHKFTCDGCLNNQDYCMPNKACAGFCFSYSSC